MSEFNMPTMVNGLIHQHNTWVLPSVLPLVFTRYTVGLTVGLLLGGVTQPVFAENMPVNVTSAPVANSITTTATEINSADSASSTSTSENLPPEHTVRINSPLNLLSTHQQSPFIIQQPVTVNQQQFKTDFLPLTPEEQSTQVEDEKEPNFLVKNTQKLAKFIWSFKPRLTDGVAGASPEKMKVTVNGAPPILEKNIKAYLSAIYVEDTKDFTTAKIRIRALAKEASEAVGYYNAQFRFTKSGKRLIVSVASGLPVIVNQQNVYVQGDAQSNTDFQQALGQLDLKDNMPLVHEHYEIVKSKLEGLARDQGYFDGVWLKHEVLVDLATNTAVVNLIYQSGVRYMVGDVYYNNEILQPSLDAQLKEGQYIALTPAELKELDQTLTNLPLVPSRLLELQPFEAGEDYDQNKVSQFTRNLNNTRYFSTLRIDVQTPDPIQEIDTTGLTSVQITQLKNEALLTETLASKQIRASKRIPIRVTLGNEKPNNLESGVGYATDTAFRFKTQYRRGLVNRYGHALESTLELSRDKQAIDFRYQIPYKNPLTDTISIFAGVQNEKTTQDALNLKTRTQTMGIERTIIPTENGWRHTMSLRYILDRLDAFGLDTINPVNLPSPFNIEGASFNQQALLAGYGLNRVYTSGGLDPDWGIRQFYQAELGAKSVLMDTNIAILRAGLSGLFSFGGADKRHQWVGRLDLGTILASDFNLVPYKLRFFAGGDQSIRGYDYKSLAPKIGDVLQGGSNLVVGSLEYNYKVLPDLRTAIFVDAGSAFDADFKNAIKVGTGVGLRWRSPVGPIRLDLGAGVRDKRMHLDSVRLHFFIGPVF